MPQSLLNACSSSLALTATGFKRGEKEASHDSLVYPRYILAASSKSENRPPKTFCCLPRLKPITLSCKNIPVEKKMDANPFFPRDSVCIFFSPSQPQRRIRKCVLNFQSSPAEKKERAREDESPLFCMRKEFVTQTRKQGLQQKRGDLGVENRSPLSLDRSFLSHHALSLYVQ